MALAFYYIDKKGLCVQQSCKGTFAPILIILGRSRNSQGDVVERRWMEVEAAGRDCRSSGESQARRPFSARLGVLTLHESVTLL
jgi:hypothetical protein